MRRRKWWIVGAICAFFAACTFVWKWSERPQFDFLRNADAPRVRISSDGKHAHISHWFRPGTWGLIRAASREIGKPPQENIRPGEARRKTRVVYWLAPRKGIDNIFILEMEGRQGTDALVTISRRATLVDRCRAWLQSLQSQEP